ncbi:hypothetical protein NDU88_003828 [Pleurodeles waltl]|uniref:Uncharacterized protein n=1 Tax=Pleurodeles waltl TaxID=8319 RepID=A0AAV7UF71_PLEWA|nr:hypothetical protein NDU88_003828 [Pleurodeles waltl]
MARGIKERHRSPQQTPSNLEPTTRDVPTAKQTEMTSPDWRASEGAPRRQQRAEAGNVLEERGLARYGTGGRQERREGNGWEDASGLLLRPAHQPRGNIKSIQGQVSALDWFEYREGLGKVLVKAGEGGCQQVLVQCVEVITIPDRPLLPVNPTPNLAHTSSPFVALSILKKDRTFLGHGRHGWPFGILCLLPGSVALPVSAAQVLQLFSPSFLHPQVPRLPSHCSRRPRVTCLLSDGSRPPRVPPFPF